MSAEMSVFTKWAKPNLECLWKFLFLKPAQSQTRYVCRYVFLQYLSKAKLGMARVCGDVFLQYPSKAEQGMMCVCEDVFIQTLSTAKPGMMCVCEDVFIQNLSKAKPGMSIEMFFFTTWAESKQVCLLRYLSSPPEHSQTRYVCWNVFLYHLSRAKPGTCCRAKPGNVLQSQTRYVLQNQLGVCSNPTVMADQPPKCLQQGSRMWLNCPNALKLQVMCVCVCTCGWVRVCMHAYLFVYAHCY